MDETIFTIGPDAALIIDEFVYDPETSAGRVTASVLKGAFRFVSGRVAKEEPRNMNVKTPVGTIGIRGTSAAGRVIPANPDDPNSEISADIVLLGPGADNNANERAGRIIVSNADTSVEISRSGFGTNIAGIDAAPTIPVRFEPSVVSGLTGDLGTDGGARPASRPAAGPDAQNGNDQSGGDGDNQPSDGTGPNNSGGSAAVQPAGPAGTTGPTSGGANASGPVGGPANGPGTPVRPAAGGGIGLGQVATLSGQTIGASVVNAGVLNQLGTSQTQAQQLLLAAVEEGAGSFNNKVTTFAQLQSIETGTATYAFNSIPLFRGPGSSVGDGGSYDAKAVIDFGARTIDLTVSNVLYTIAGSGGHSFVFDEGIGNGPNDNFSNDTGLASNTWNSTDNAADFTTAPTGGHLVEIEAQINNNLNTGVIASEGRINVKVSHAGAVIEGNRTVDKQ